MSAVLRPRYPRLENPMMSRSVPIRLLLAGCLIAAIFTFTGCTRDPNVRKQKYFDSGEKYFAARKYREAAIQYSNAIQIDPRFAQAHSQLAQAYLNLGDKQRAYQELNRVVDLDPENYRAHTDLANLLVTSPNAEDIKAAKTHLDWLRQKQPNTPETHEAWANYYASQSNFPAAIQEINQALQLDPNRSESYLLRALLELRSNLPVQAE